MQTIQRPLQRSPPAYPGQRPHLSYSAVSLFQACPLRFAFHYILGLPEETVSASLIFGSAMHAAVQHRFEQLLIGRETDLDALLAVYQASWNERRAQAIRFGRGETQDSLNHLADRMLRAFLRSDYAHPQGVIVGVEEELRGGIVAGCPDVLGRLDLIIDTGDGLLVSDFKTTRTGWSEGRVKDQAGQLLLYSELAKEMADGRPIRLAFAVLTKSKMPELTLHPVETDPGQIARTKRIVERVWRAIAARNIYPSPSPLHCPTCPYRRPCRRWTG